MSPPLAPPAQHQTDPAKAAGQIVTPVGTPHTGGWIGVDFDGTLAEYEHWNGAEHVGAPIAPMVARVKAWLAEGKEVRVFTARCWPYGVVRPNGKFEAADRMAPLSRYREASAAVRAIQRWCLEHLGQALIVTCVKDYGMIELYDDRAVQVESNTGRLVGMSTRGNA